MTNQSPVYTLTIKGMRCNNCANGLETALNKIPNVSATVSFASETAQIITGHSSLTDVIDTVKNAGYDIQTVHERLSVTGWSCTGCANKTKQLIESIIGVTNVQTNSANNLLSFDAIKGVFQLHDIYKTLESQGYSAHPANEEINNQQAHPLILHWKIILAITLTIPLLIPMIGMLFQVTIELAPWLEFTLATIVQFVVGGKFYRGAWQSLKNKQANMDTLVTLGTSAAYFYSCYVFFSGTVNSGVYFESSAVIITFVSIGKWLENRAKYAAGQAMRGLLSLQPMIANRIVDGQMTSIAVEMLSLDDVVRVLPQSKIPVDGILVNGESDVDESLISGESAPVHKRYNDHVCAGSLNGTGIIDIQVTATGNDSSLSQIIAMVEQAQSTKAPIERLVDTIAAWFVPIVMVIAAITLLGWLSIGATFETALINCVAVLVVACPCALGLATPAAIVVGSGVAAKHGIIIRDPQALQIAGKIDIVAFDKTGTLTLGKPVLKEVNWYSKDGMPSYLCELKSVAEHSQHPLSQTLANAPFLKNSALVDMNGFTEIAGQGIHATINSQTVLLGNKTLMLANNIIIDFVTHNIDASYVFYAINGKLIAVFSLIDTVREQSKPAIDALKKQGIGTVMLSGDNINSACKVAQELTIDNYQATLKPADKLSYLLSLQTKGQRVAMVGDGINDAPALAQANLGIAMGGGTQTAIESAQITLMQDNPLLVYRAINIAKATWRTVKQNLTLAFLFNGCAIPAAALGYLTPQLAGLAMALSSVTVLANALLLKRKR